MKKFIFGLGALIVIGIVVVLFHQKHNKVESKQKTAVAKYGVDSVDSVDAENWFYNQSLSDKDIYFKADTLLPDIPVINDMVDVANGYAILRAAAEQYVKTLMNIKPKDTALS